MAEHLRAFNLRRWVDEHRHLLKPPIGAEPVWKDSEFLIMAIGGPNARRDFHIDPRDEFFFQLEGDMVLEYIDANGKRQRETIREGDVLLLPANTPHSPQRPANTIGLVVEPVRRPDEPESYAWYCERCDGKLYELARSQSDILADLRSAAEKFNASEALRTCRACGFVQPVPTGPRL
ncbi:MAG TPA: 3-hydroxyanthranilate 3,4-dioxygenase [Methylomirabilota bacterium]|nr:3-hydroxyanthranilate 3,4-dioxygenase [Methylomirabilota bacterium]